jgi:hypothetical protein
MLNWKECEKKQSSPNLKAVFRDFPGGIEKDNEKLQSGYSMTLSRIEMDSSRTQIRSVTLGSYPPNVTSTLHEAYRSLTLLETARRKLNVYNNMI